MPKNNKNKQGRVATAKKGGSIWFSPKIVVASKIV